MRPLITTDGDPARALSHATRVLDTAASIESFLEDLDGAPPDWAAVLRDGGEHDERLSALNRQRDRRRGGSPVLEERVTFFWLGELSDRDAETGGFRVAVGPKLIRTRWGQVRFKPESLPGSLVVVPSADQTDALQARVDRGERIDIQVAFTGRLVPEESLIYDLTHEEPREGLVMPVVLIDRIDYFARP
ncbi:hypothetical protein [Candidatus Nitrospira bockiana]